VDVTTAAAALGESAALGLIDVGSLLAAGPEALAALRRVAGRIDELLLEAMPREAVRLAPPVLAPSKIVCVGLNYALHAAEGKVALPALPLLFAKLSNTLIGDGEPVIYPPITAQLDYEGELGVIIGRRASSVREADAMAYVGGFTIVNDISARDLQISEPQWIRGKSLDTFAPMGPYVVTPDEVQDVGSLRIRTTVNGEIRQDASCADMVFGVERLIAFISEAITLEPGDVIATGTPPGVGLGFDPPRYLDPGDVVEVTIEPIGTLRSPIQAPAVVAAASSGESATVTRA
jgi:2-keto-4-pentenoate hydratase/2-oxohepta-3-ene-1,7-dioic acid hydratase in catechol pathway